MAASYSLSSNSGQFFNIKGSKLFSIFKFWTVLSYQWQQVIPYLQILDNSLISKAASYSLSSNSGQFFNIKGSKLFSIFKFCSLISKAASLSNCV